MKNNFRKNTLSEIIKNEINEDATIIQEVEFPSNNNQYKIYVKREDLLHPKISGNKWRKLKYNLLEADKQNVNTLLTFGGAYSNHIHATAYAGKIFGFNTIGIIRGEEHLPINPTLSDAQKCGMKIHYVNRSDYRKKRDESFINSLRNKFGEFYLVPEGGTNNLAVKGCTEIVKDININFDYILTACGTGGTISGVIAELDGNKNVIGVPVLKGAGFLNNEITEYVKAYSGKTYSNWNLALDYHHGGYAKVTKELVLFIKEFEKLNNIPLDPIYTGKLMFALNDMIKLKHFSKGSTIIVLHTGGLQGIKGMENRINKLLS